MYVCMYVFMYIRTYMFGHVYLIMDACMDICILQQCTHLVGSYNCKSMKHQEHINNTEVNKQLFRCSV